MAARPSLEPRHRLVVRPGPAATQTCPGQRTGGQGLCGAVPATLLTRVPDTWEGLLPDSVGVGLPRSHMHSWVSYPSAEWGMLGGSGGLCPSQGPCTPRGIREGPFALRAPHRGLMEALANRGCHRGTLRLPARPSRPFPHVLSCPGSLCLRPLPQWRLLLQYPGLPVLPLQLPPGLHRQRLRHG